MKFFKKLFMSMNEIDLEIYADQVKDPATRIKILEQYILRWQPPSETPLTHPWKYDPLDPPRGWRYDPFYETWLKSNHD